MLQIFESKHRVLNYFKQGLYMKKKESKGQAKIKKVMHEMKEGKLHSGSKKGPIVSNPKQGIAIALSEARKAGAKVAPKKKAAKKGKK